MSSIPLEQLQQETKLSDNGAVPKMQVSDLIKQRIRADKAQFKASDNISKYVHDGELPVLVEEVKWKFQKVLDSLIIDTDNDPNSKDTAKRLAKMYVYELMSGRYDPMPDVTSFPNEGENRFEGMLVVRAEIRSMCSHHHQPVKGVCYIGIIPTGRVIGLSKYVRLAQWCARRGQLQEELVNQIAKEIMKATDTENVAVYIEATHGCMDNRGVMAHSSMTQTSAVHGLFHNNSVKQEFFDNIKLQSMKS
jgi:GTP cyclohydrolase I